MRLTKIAAFLLVCIALMATLITGSVMAQSDVIARAYRTVNVRSGPGTQYDIIGQLNSGNEAEITGRSDSESDWLRINFQGVDGWVAYFTVTVLGNTDQLEIVTPPAPQMPLIVIPVATPTQALGNVYVTAFRTVNVRTGPGIEYALIGSLEDGNSANVTGRSDDDEWLRINFSGQDGWVAYFVVSLTGSLDNIDSVQAPPDAATEAAPSETIPVVTHYNLNLHQAPSLDSPILDIVPFNTTLQAEARADESGSWIRVTYNGEVGWLITTLVGTDGDLGDLPIAQPGTGGGGS